MDGRVVTASPSMLSLAGGDAISWLVRVSDAPTEIVVMSEDQSPGVLDDIGDILLGIGVEVVTPWHSVDNYFTAKCTNRAQGWRPAWADPQADVSPIYRALPGRDEPESRGARIVYRKDFTAQGDIAVAATLDGKYSIAMEQVGQIEAGATTLQQPELWIDIPNTSTTNPEVALSLARALTDAAGQLKAVTTPRARSNKNV